MRKDIVKRGIVLVFSFFGLFGANAQTEFTLHKMNTIPQSTYNNPAFMPKFNSYLGLPGISSIFLSEYNSGFSYNDVFERRIDDSLLVNLNKLSDKLEEKNYFTNEQEIDLLSFGSRLNPKMYLSFNLSAKDMIMLQYPDDILGLVIDGNRSFIGETMNLEMKFDGISYLETGLGLAYKVNDKLTVGSRIKYLSGIMNVDTKSAGFGLYTAEDYSITLTGDVLINSSGIDEITDEDFEFNASDISDYFRNNGFAFDIGATYQVTDNISVEASIVDIGSIKWKNDTKTYFLDKDIAEFTWEGLDIQKLVNDEDELETLLDSLENSFEFKEADRGTYKTSLPMRSYISGTYQLPRNAQLSMVFFSEKFKKNVQAGLGFVANKQVAKILDLSLSYSIRKNTYNNLGFGFSLRLPPFQLYAVSDNLLGAPFYPNDVKYLSLRAGLNLVFNWHKSQTAIPNSIH